MLAEPCRGVFMQSGRWTFIQRGHLAMWADERRPACLARCPAGREGAAGASWRCVSAPLGYWRAVRNPRPMGSYGRILRVSAPAAGSMPGTLARAGREDIQVTRWLGAAW
jgi:hypothetical protein